MDIFLQLLAGLIAVTVVLTLHEFAHALVAYACGDPTAKYAGRMTLNPLKHFDPLGLFLFVFAHFGWAKPVPINPNNFKNRRWGSFCTSAAGILMNYLSALIVFFPLWCLTAKYALPVFEGKYMEIFLSALMRSLYSYSISFAVFNFLPIYPLDGYRMWESLSRRDNKVLRFLRKYGSYILMALIVINILSDYVGIFRYINLLGFVMQYLASWISWPITQLWGLVFGI